MLYSRLIIVTLVLFIQTATARPKWPTACMWFDKPQPDRLYGEEMHLIKTFEANDKTHNGVAQWRSPTGKKHFWVNKDANDVEVGYYTYDHDIHTTWMLTFTLPLHYHREYFLKGQIPKTMEHYLIIDPVKFPKDQCNRQFQLGWNDHTVSPYVYDVKVQRVKPMCGNQICKNW